ncbi:hypothetical protein [Bacillus cereus]|uniref:hypothetical protein n=1 Tax=Bacillus cereus TaxID=1396 RepID=UPI00032E8382|nr:hypothetical protein [Bacillus cereus]EOO44431.1 hypothetical protein ICK_06206 [Bacillus cereus BAG1X2-2]
MSEQLLCGHCGKPNWSQWFETCECQNPDFRFKTIYEYEEYQNKIKQQNIKK